MVVYDFEAFGTDELEILTLLLAEICFSLTGVE